VYDRVLPGALNGSFSTLLSPPQCHAIFGTMPHTLALLNQSPVCHRRVFCPSAMRTFGNGFWKDIYIYIVTNSQVLFTMEVYYTESSIHDS
jgi:hypothetical protein